ncbi:MAG: hypothetical protein QOH25_239 [Acidobacteriota bacterium]|nr:hypothetical protein [Acidobacteriota bacterium]
MVRNTRFAEQKRLIDPLTNRLLLFSVSNVGQYFYHRKGN